jgi:hypothetical protein
MKIKAGTMLAFFYALYFVSQFQLTPPLSEAALIST